MSQLKTKGIVLVENNLGDYDKMLTILTPGMRQNKLCCQRRKKTQKPFNGGYTIFVLRRLHVIQRQ